MNDTDDDFARARSPSLKVVEDRALNLESHPALLDPPLTPDSAFFVRNNGSLPPRLADAAERWRLVVDGEVARPLELSLAELKARFETVEVTAVLECAGNRRARFSPPAAGLPWGDGAVACARWTGVRMADLLAAAGVKSSAVYTGHESPDRDIARPDAPAISRGLPIAKALAPETLVAFAMNGEALPFLHGYPLRVVAPGFPGSAWQKWLTRIWVRDREHDGARMTGLDYRLPRRPIRPDDPVDPAEFEVIADIKVNSMITRPADGFRVAAGRPFEVRGHAWSGHVPVASVAVSADGGWHWVAAELAPATDRFAWRRFRATVAAPAGPVRLIARATDVAGVAQPLDSAPWNPRGYGNNVVHGVTGFAA